VEILNQDESQILAVVVALPDHRMRPEIDSEFTFHLARPGFPTPVQTWYYAGDMTGLEFVYPKSRAKEIARESEGHVMASNDSKDAVIVAITPNGKEVVIEGPLPETAKRKSQ
jgi:hypothetical protein